MLELKSRKEVVTEALNQQLDVLYRLMIDFDFLTAMALANPTVEKYSADKKNVESKLNETKKLVETCRKHLAEAEAEEKGAN